MRLFRVLLDLGFPDFVISAVSAEVGVFGVGVIWLPLHLFASVYYSAVISTHDNADLLHLCDVVGLGLGL